MRRIICVPFLLAALTALSVLPVQDCLAYGPGDSWYYGCLLYTSDAADEL